MRGEARRGWAGCFTRPEPEPAPAPLSVGGRASIEYALVVVVVVVVLYLEWVCMYVYMPVCTVVTCFIVTNVQ